MFRHLQLKVGAFRMLIVLFVSATYESMPLKDVLLLFQGTSVGWRNIYQLPTNIKLSILLGRLLTLVQKMSSLVVPELEFYMHV